ncbi:ABC transporter substrate-binding protein [Clostridium sporogenes]|uniref:ABC transporter substrate-binding protein n=1 Tax=Clostridium sporogenes TaxID=1509 RepID=UPI0013CF77B8|nr:ABC transporter substrate-binding protein [Clostridium sporogenes]NFP90235.1 transporter substrate-binding domain-containing protein [Clostridium sporogenes]
MSKKILGKLGAIIISLTMVISLVACGKNTASNEGKSKVDKIKESGKLVIGTCADYPPYEFHKTINGKDEIVGFDITIAKEIAKDLGVKLEIKDMKFDGLLAALQSGNVDMVIAGMNPTEDRKKSVNFSKIYYQAIQSVVVRAEDKDKFKSIEEFKGKKIGVQKGTTQEEVAKKEMTNSEIKSLGKVTDLVLELQNKKVDGLVLENPVAVSYAKNGKNLAVSNVKFENKDKGASVAVKKGNKELVDAIDKTLDKLIKEKSIDKFVTDANEQVE